MTDRLYYTDSYTHQFSAEVVEQVTDNDRPAVILDHTYFYPSGGGQPNDNGSIAGVEVLDVNSRDDHAVVHTLAGEIKSGPVDCQIDYLRRFDHMQQHTGQHILTRAFINAADADTVAFHLGVDSVTIDLNKTGLSPDTVDRVEDLANQIIAENRTITARIISQEEFAALNARARKIPESLATDGIRVIEVADFDVVACGGTHVAHAGELGLIKVLRLERNANETRVEFRCGWRALRDYRLKNTITNTLAADLTTAQGELDQAVTRLKSDLKEARSALKDTQARLSDYEAAALLSSAPMRGDIRLIRGVFAGRDVADVRSLASRLNENPSTVVLLGIPGDKAQLLFTRSADLSMDMASALKRALATLGSDRGGGRPEFAQGGGVAADEGQINTALDEAERAVFG